MNEPITYMKINRHTKAQTEAQTKATLRHRPKQHDTGTDKSKQTKATLKIKTQTKDDDADNLLSHYSYMSHIHMCPIFICVPYSYVSHIQHI